MKTYSLYLLILSFSVTLAQEVKIPLVVTDNAGGTATLYFGLDPKATDGIDPSLGESPLPPLPPTGSFDARFILPGSDDSQVDYRFGYKTSITGSISYEIQFQIGNGNNITISRKLPKGVTGNLQDKFGGIVVNKAMTTDGNITVTNHSITKLDMIVQYNFVPSGFDDSKSKVNQLSLNYILQQNYPNPFNPTTLINYSIPKSEFVTIKVYDLLGQEIATLVNGDKTAGNHRVEFNARRLTSGVYYYRMESGKFSQTKKFIVEK